MRKEVIAAVITGIVLGVIVAFGVWRANVALKPESQTLSESSSPTAQEEVQTSEFGLTIAKPEQNQVITESPFSVSGITKSGSWIAISGEEEDYVIQADAKGEFIEEVELIGGVNQLVITAFNEEGEEISQNLTLVYSTEFATKNNE